MNIGNIDVKLDRQKAYLIRLCINKHNFKSSPYKFNIGNIFYVELNLVISPHVTQKDVANDRPLHELTQRVCMQAATPFGWKPNHSRQSQTSELRLPNLVW